MQLQVLMLPVYVGAWLLVLRVLALVSGWSLLARAFPAGNGRPSRSHAQAFRFVGGNVGTDMVRIGQGYTMFVTIDDEGFRVAHLPLLGMFHPPIAVPWREVEAVEVRRGLLRRRTVLCLRGLAPRIEIYGRAGRALLAQASARQDGAT